MLFIFSPTLGQNQAYEYLLNLEFERTRKHLESQTLLAPFDLYTANLNDCTDLLLNGSSAHYQEYKKRYEERLNQLDALPNEPIKGFVSSELRLQWAFVAGKYGDNWNAFWNLRKAIKEVENNISKYPSFEPHYRTQGLLNMILGLIPSNKKWLLNLFNMTGDFELGYRQLKNATTISSQFAEESKAILALVDSYILEQATEIDLSTEKAIFRYVNGLTFAKQHMAKKAIESFQSIDEELVIKPYLIGESYFISGSYEKAIEMYSMFLAKPDVENYRKDALLKIGLCHWFKDSDRRQAEEFFKKAKESPKGDSEIDKNADHILERSKELNKELLMIRYALDGGNFTKAKVIIDQVQKEDLTAIEVLEFNYRKARYFQLTNDLSQSIEYFQKVIKEGENEVEIYFIPYSYLQLGRIYESLNETLTAVMYYEKALQFKDYTYKQSIDLKARIAINALDHSND